MKSPLLEVRDVTVEYRHGRHRPSVRALDQVSVSLAPGETLGLVGESGSGKSTLSNALLGLVPVKQGTITFDGQDITAADWAQRRRVSRDLQVVFQDPYSSLNPSRTIGQTLAEPLLVHNRQRRATTVALVAEALERVGLPASARDKFPGSFSGGQRQRIAIARALMLSPKLVICDEAVSALDLSVQAQILNLLRDLQRELSLSYLFISHDLAVVRHVSHRVAVLRKGRIVETGPTKQVYQSPSHPYTQALLGAVPVPNPRAQRARRESKHAMSRNTPDSPLAADWLGVS